MNKTVAVTGAGASGLVAAAGAASLGARVLLFDQNDRIGRKLSATGNGKGNIANCRMEEQCYHSEEPEELSRIYRDIHRDEVLQLLEDRGIVLHARQGYIYPRTDLAATVTEGLWQWIAEVGTELHLQEAVTGVQKVPSGFLIRTGTGEEYRERIPDRPISRPSVHRSPSLPYCIENERSCSAFCRRRTLSVDGQDGHRQK